MSLLWLLTTEQHLPKRLQAERVCCDSNAGAVRSVPAGNSIPCVLSHCNGTHAEMQLWFERGLCAVSLRAVWLDGECAEQQASTALWDQILAVCDSQGVAASENTPYACECAAVCELGC
jgi:hypothetical protein